MSDELDDFLAHYGVKGMKWGVRREQKRTARQTAKNFREYSAKTIQDRRAGKRLSALDYANLSDQDVVVKRGSALRRITRNPDGSLPGRAYVSTLEEDSTKYRAILPLRGDPTKRQRSDYGKQYEITMESTRRLTSPSAKKRVDAFVELLDSKIDIPGPPPRTMTGKEYLSKTGYGKEIKQLNSQEAGLRFYSKFNAKAGDANNPINDAYFNKLKDRGYNYVIDDNDLGFISKQPMILLDPKGTVKVKEVRPLTAEEINAAQIEVFGPKKEVKMSGMADVSVDDFLAHYGVKGMKWGVTRDNPGGGSSGAPSKRQAKKIAKIEKNRQILEARSRQAARERKYEEAQGDFIVARTKKGQDKAEKIMRQMEKEFFTNPDAEMAAKMTSGEKTLNAISWGVTGVMAASYLAIAAGTRR